LIEADRSYPSMGHTHSQAQQGQQRAEQLQETGGIHVLKSRTARPAAARLSNRISEYLREKMSPSAPARKAALVAAYVSSGEALRLRGPVGMPMSRPGRILQRPATPARARCVSRKT